MKLALLFYFIQMVILGNSFTNNRRIKSNEQFIFYQKY